MPAAQTDKPYQPTALLPGGIVLTLFPPDSKYLNAAKINIPEKYSMHKDVPGRVQSIVSIHNPSIEVHLVDNTLNTGTAVILAAGGGHNTLNVGSEANDFVAFFYNYGVNTIILRNRLRADGYNPQTDEVNDMQQAIRLVRAHAKEWRLDPNKIGAMGFSAGAELVAPAALYFDRWDQANNDASDPLAGISSRPDFAGIIYPGPTPFSSRGGTAPAIPRNMPPSFTACAGSGDAQHAAWANDWFTAMLGARVPDIEMHIYARGHHPGDRAGPDEPASTGGLTDRGDTPYGTWQNRFIDWFRDLGFLQKPGVETIAAKEIVRNPPRGGAGGAPGGGGPAGAGGAGGGRRGGAGRGAPAGGAPGGAVPGVPVNP
jgi:endo-1,4-beta-xylanase